MDIPDEAWRAARYSARGHLTAHSAVEAAVKSAAPHIARAAQVAKLRELHDRWMVAAGRPGANMQTLMWAGIACAVEANEVEAGAGQTGAENAGPDEDPTGRPLVTALDVEEAEVVEACCTCEPLWTGEAPPAPNWDCPAHGQGT